MELSVGIRKIGFRRWYERQLIESHLYLVSGFLCFVTVLACLEGFNIRAPGLEPLAWLAAMIAGCVVCTWSLTRYKTLLDFAEYAAERSVCEKCETYGVLEVTGARAGNREGEADTRGALIGVRCRRCGHEWTIE